MKIEEAIKDIKENIKPIVGGISLDMAIESLENQISNKNTERLQTELSMKIDDIDIEYGAIPSGLIQGWEGIVYYFRTEDSESHERIVSKVIQQLQHQSYDHGSEWRKTKIEAVVWNEHRQITLVSFRVKDSY